mgnify:CR=1 FL=1
MVDCLQAESPQTARVVLSTATGMRVLSGGTQQALALQQGLRRDVGSRLLRIGFVFALR